MRFLIPALALLFFSCQKEITGSNSPASGGSGAGGGTGGGTPGTTVTLGVQKQLFASIYHNFTGVLDANNKRIMFVVHNNTTSVDDFYAGDDKDSVYLLTPYENPNSFNVYNATLSLKPNGEIACIYKKANATGPDSILALVNKPGKKTWDLVKREISNSFWNTYYTSTELFMASTATGRLVLTGTANTKVAVSDDNGLNWHQTFTLPSTYLNTSHSQRNSFSGTRSFIISGNMFLYSDNDFEAGTLVIIDPFGGIKNKILKLDDQRLVLQYDTPLRTIYQSSNNGQSWSVMPLYDSADTLTDFSTSYFCFVSGNKIRLRAKYQRCNSYYTVDIDPMAKFAFYPLTPPTCPLPTSADDVIACCQREDKRMYYAMSYSNGANTFCIISRDY